MRWHPFDDFVSKLMDHSMVYLYRWNYRSLTGTPYIFLNKYYTICKFHFMVLIWQSVGIELLFIIDDILTRYWPWWRSLPCRGGTPRGPSHSWSMRRGDRREGGSRSSGNKEILICLIGPDRDTILQTNGQLYCSGWDGAGRGECFKSNAVSA